MIKIITYIKSVIIGIINSFPAQSFEGDWYGWIKNQFGHTCMTYIACIYFCLAWEYSWAILAGFWLWWEIRHYIKTKDELDLREDLFFELSGVGLYLLGSHWAAYVSGIVYLSILIGLTIKKRIKWQS